MTLDLDAAFGKDGVSFAYTAESGDDAVATVSVRDGQLSIDPQASGVVSVSVTATGDDGSQTVRSFDVRVASVLDTDVAYMPATGDERREGFVRVINRSAAAGEARIRPVDADGGTHGPLTLSLPAHGTRHFNSGDLERGNPSKGLSGGVGPVRGGWRLEVDSDLDIEVLSYIRTRDGFLTAMHDTVPENGGVHHVAIFNPGSNTGQVSLLRVNNPGPKDALVTVRGIDDHGASPGGEVEMTVPAGAERTISAADLESGSGVTGALGDGAGKWRLTVSSDAPIQVMSLLESPGGHLTNLSTVPAAEGALRLVPLFPSASDALGRQGFVRVINAGATAAEVAIGAFDESDRDYDPLTLTVAAREAVHFNSDDLELGNAGKGLTGSTGSGVGDWRLELRSDADLEVLSYIRTLDGFLTSMHDVAPGVENRYRVAVFNPGSNTSQVSVLRLINVGGEDAAVRIEGIDDAGVSPGLPVALTVPAGGSREVSAAELESGEGMRGKLGDGTGKWRLTVASEQPVLVMSLLSSPTGHLTNLSTVPVGLHASGSNSITIEDGEIYKDGEFANFGTGVDPALPPAWVVSGADVRLDGVRVYADGSVRADIDPNDAVVDPDVRYFFTFEWEDETLVVERTGDIVDVRFTPPNAAAVTAFYELLVNDTAGSVTLSDAPRVAATPRP